MIIEACTVYMLNISMLMVLLLHHFGFFLILDTDSSNTPSQREPG
jgi:hypothetical protein